MSRDEDEGGENIGSLRANGRGTVRPAIAGRAMAIYMSHNHSQQHKHRHEVRGMVEVEMVQMLISGGPGSGSRQVVLE